MKYRELRDLVYNVAKELSGRGPGWAQQKAVLWEVMNRQNASGDEKLEQQILTCWHDLFRIGRLSWGYNIDNPDAPFYHIPNPDAERDREAK